MGVVWPIPRCELTEVEVVVVIVVVALVLVLFCVGDRFVGDVAIVVVTVIVSVTCFRFLVAVVVCLTVLSMSTRLPSTTHKYPFLQKVEGVSDLDMSYMI